MSETITFECTECKRRNYQGSKNKSKKTGRLEFRKYCPFCRKHTLHREVR
ncbi:50S ribosomal protein L33 [Candidatus Caldatribacterium saccharofermentans]|uniref:Large ribosomal subunit protein bL33 n=1 Tax=Candidatus Caldatribacterium saccharofermentans TaxID=1454753 RepID=A0A7V4TFW2_9BACT